MKLSRILNIYAQETYYKHKTLKFEHNCFHSFEHLLGILSLMDKNSTLFIQDFKTQKKIILPISIISNSCCISFLNLININSSFPMEERSSTYKLTMSILSSMFCLTNVSKYMSLMSSGYYIWTGVWRGLFILNIHCSFL